MNGPTSIKLNECPTAFFLGANALPAKLICYNSFDSFGLVNLDVKIK